MKSTAKPEKSIWDLLSDTSALSELPLDDRGLPTEDAVMDYLDDGLSPKALADLEQIIAANPFFADRIKKLKLLQEEREQRFLSKVSGPSLSNKLIVVQISPPRDSFLFVARILHIAASEKRGGGVQTTDQSGRVTFAVEQVRDIETGDTALEVRIRVARDKTLFEAAGRFELWVDDEPIFQCPIQLTKGKCISRIPFKMLQVETQRVHYRLSLKEPG